jgi:hypothetical protein
MTDRYAIVPFNGSPPPEAIVVGDLDAVMRYLPQTVAAEELEQRALDLAARVEAREQALTDGLRKLAPSVSHFMDVCSRLVDDAEAQRAEQVRQDAEAEARKAQAHVQAYLDQQSDPGGELRALGPVDKEKYDPEADDLIDPAELGGPKDPHQIAPPISVSLNEATP